MKPIKFAKFLVLALAVTVAAAGCKKTPIKPTEITDTRGGTLKLRGPDKTTISEPPAAPPATVDNGIARSPGDTTGLTGNGNGRPGGSGLNGENTQGDRFTPPPRLQGTNVNDGTTEPIKNIRLEGAEDATILEKESVYFDFDSSAVKVSEKHKIAPVVEYLKSNLNHKLRIKGNCDERGTEEYNRSLGERRALALRAELLGQGIDPDRIETVTNGKDLPKALGHDEASWRENRRGDFVVLLPLPAP